MKIINKKNAFTFVELIVVVTILSILWAIWFASYIEYIWDSRDSQRKTDLSQVWSWLKIYKQKRWYYPLPWNNYNITYSWTTVAIQWKLNNNVRINSLEVLPLDPKAKIPYLYSITKNQQEFELVTTLENQDNPITLVNWNYKSVSKNILPTILLATSTTEWLNLETQSWTVEWDINRKLFIYNNQSHNLPYNFVEPYNPISDWTSFDELLSESEYNDSYWQNSDFRNCVEIKEGWKLIIPLDSNPFEYQIITDTWALINTWCTL